MEEGIVLTIQYRRYSSFLRYHLVRLLVNADKGKDVKTEVPVFTVTHPSGLAREYIPLELRGNGCVERRKDDGKGKIGDRPIYEACSEAE